MPGQCWLYHNMCALPTASRGHMSSMQLDLDTSAGWLHLHSWVLHIDKCAKPSHLMPGLQCKNRCIKGGWVSISYHFCTIINTSRWKAALIMLGWGVWGGVFTPFNSQHGGLFKCCIVCIVRIVCIYITIKRISLIFSHSWCVVGPGWCLQCIIFLVLCIIFLVLMFVCTTSISGI